VNEWLAQFQLPESAALRRTAAGRACGGTIFALLDLAFAAWMLTLISLAYACGAPGKSDRAHAGSMAFMMSSCLFRESGSAIRSR
jgi:hypothetical protein